MKLEKENRLKEIANNSKDVRLKNDIDKKLTYINKNKTVKK